MREKIIVAIDSPDLKTAENLILSLNETEFFKIGLQSFLAFGDEITELIKELGKKLFLDLKFKDIPNTVAGAVKSVLKYNPEFLTIHLSGGKEMILGALEASRQKKSLKIVGVTILTSLDKQDLEETGIDIDAKNAVLKLVELGISCGVKYFVCSPKELEFLKERFGNEIILITPGIRPTWSSTDDQKRVFTPQKAISSGADYLVIGRPVTGNDYPSKAFKRIVSEIT